MIAAKSAVLKNGLRIGLLSRTQSTSPEVKEEPSVQYPSIHDLSPKAVFRRKQQEYFDKIKNHITTVEQKIHALNLPKYYGWPSYMVKESHLPYNYLPFVQFITRTAVNETKSLPLYCTSDKVEKVKNILKSELEKILLLENSTRHRHEVEPLFANEQDIPYYTQGQLNDFKLRPFIKQFNNTVMRVLAQEYPHLHSCQLDVDPRMEAFWRVGGFHPTDADVQLRKKKEFDESMLNDPIDRFIQYFGNPIVQVRSELPLQPVSDIIGSVPKITSLEESNEHGVQPSVTESNIVPADGSDSKDTFYYPPQEYRYMADLYLDIPRERQLGTIVPGFWPNDSHKFGILSYHSTNHLLDRPERYGCEDFVEILHAQASLAMYAWTYIQACYQGFTTYNDITYPFVSQAVLTNGKVFSFYLYQLNTCVLHTDYNEPHNPLYNTCHATTSAELYHDIGVDRVEGWNDDTLLNLISIYANLPSDRGGIDLCPYLSKNIKYISQMPNIDERLWWYKYYHFITSRRPRHALPPEIYDWERIYKIENNARLIDAAKRFFEKFEDPINDRKLFDHPKDYIKKRERAKGAPSRRPSYYIEVVPDYHEIV